MSLVFVNGEFIDIPDDYMYTDINGLPHDVPNVYTSPPGVPDPPTTYEPGTDTYFLSNDQQDDTSQPPTPAQIAAAERGTNFEGRSFGPDQAAKYRADAIAAGVPDEWITGFLARNPNDYNRIIEGYYSDADMEDTRTGAPNIREGGSGGGGGGYPGAFAPPPNAIGWMPTLDLPTWTPPAPFEAPAPFTHGAFSYPDYVKPADYVPGTFAAPTIEEARQEPGFQFALDEGRRQMEASAAAKGIGRTGGTVKRLIGYGQEMADTNYGNVYNRNLGTFNVNEGNRAGAYTTNANLGFGAYTTNRANAADTFATNYGVAKDTYDYGYKALADEYASRYGTSKQKHDYDTAEATGEFAPRKEEAVLTHQQAFAEWLTKMGIAQNIFNEGSD